jgi:hypothetical protein
MAGMAMAAVGGEGCEVGAGGGTADGGERGDGGTGGDAKGGGGMYFLLAGTTAAGEGVA